MRARLAAACLVAAVVWGGTVGPAQGHALLSGSSPADGATVEEAPPELVLSFTEPADPALATIKVIDAAGRPVEAGRAEPVAGQPAQLRIPLRPLDAGAYTATWRITSSVDGHTTLGSVAFGVGVPVVPAAAAGGPVGRVQAPAPTPAGVAGRWLFAGGAGMLLAAAVVGLVVVSDARCLPRRLLAAAWGAGAAGVVLVVADARASTGAGLVTLLGSSTGQRLVAQAAAVGLAGVAVTWLCLRSRARPAMVLLGLAAAAALLARALAGHANASSPRWFTVGTQWAHLAAAGAWAGGLVWLLVAMRAGDPGRGRGLVRRFSTAAAWALAVVALSGAARAVDEVGAWDRLASTRFGVTLMVKVGLFAVLVALAAVSRYRYLPRLGAAGAPVGAAVAAPAAGGLRRSVRAEVAAAAAVLAAGALLAGFPPPKSVAAASREALPAEVAVTGSDYGTSVRVRLVVEPGLPGPNRFEATVADYDTGGAVPATAVSLRFRLPGRTDLAPPALALAGEAGGRWVGEGGALSVGGRWQVTAVVETAADAVEVPLEVPVRPPPTGPAATPGAGCAEVPADPAYSLAWESTPSPPVADGTAFRLTLRRDGRPVVGARVCLRVDMPDMQHPGVSNLADESAPGRYETRLRFPMTGGWEGSVILTEPGRPAASVPIRFEVQ